MTYLSLARKYRPQVFDEIVGQGHIATTLKNAISMGMVAHAYLFTGPRGVGKTSTARILAKGLNCEKAPTSEPCGACASCREISGGTGMDVIEIDGASNRGIDEIRNLKENIKFTPIGGKFRIYIIDEVHMLTQEAFNALLKTLEEPPLHVKFIFATTKPYKVLPTIISRCQRFDFRKISIEEITGKLKEIREKEKLTLADGAISLIAKYSDGSLRDAEVILDQLLSFTKGKVEAPDVVKVLGLLEEDALFEIADCLLGNDKKKLLNLIDGLIKSGKDPVFITACIIGHFRNLLAAGITKEGNARLREQAEKFSTDGILYIIYTLSAAMDLIKKTPLGRIPLEVSLIKLTEMGRLGSIKEILKMVQSLQGRPSGIASSAPSAPPRNDYKKGSDPFYPSEAPKPSPAVSRNEIVAEHDRLLLQKIKDSWAKILNLLKSRKMSVATFLSEGALLRVKEDKFTIGFDENNLLHKEALEGAENRKFVEDAIENVVGEKLRLMVETFEGGEEPPAPAAPMPDEREPNRVEPIVESAADMFGGRIVDIRGNKGK